ncbi:ABC transporter substrate-binding protein [Bacteroidales bacterium OttesenSCG-928-I14]|nr:ABC transporter substrate-binding protein [Bacteroidales bacterium OttesenSCG-928-I14]
MKRLIFFTILGLLISCKGNREFPSISKGNDYTEYASGFTVEEKDGYKIVSILTSEKKEVIQTLALVHRQAELLPDKLPEGAVVIRTPLDRVVSFSSVTCGMIHELGKSETIVGLTEPDYISIPQIKDAVEGGKIVNLGMANNPNIEEIMLLEPEAIFINPYSEIENILQKVNFPVIQCLDFQETLPLGQTEWIRFMGLLFEEEELADSLFNETCKRYNYLKELTVEAKNPPCVFTEKRYEGVWYMPGGQSYLANLFKDAGVQYLWKEDTNTGSVSFTFETVLNEAENCDYWLLKYYSPNDLSYSQLEAEYPNYALFSAFKNKKVFGCNTSKCSYYEELPLHPDWLLEDMIGIFYPELLPEYNPRYYFPLQ